MGREATCRCQWGEQSGQCKVLLETHDLIVRGSIRRRAPIASLKQVRAIGGELHFEAGGDAVVMSLGTPQAERWAAAMAAPPPSLKKKLGITEATRLLVMGDVDDAELQKAIADVPQSDAREADLMLAVAATGEDLNRTLQRHASCALQPALWIVYAKGPKSPVGETQIRSLLRERGFMDIKVASVSATLTAPKFIKRP